jgi:DNA invertase Pin-like site-specific DNA recombinase
MFETFGIYIGPQRQASGFIVEMYALGVAQYYHQQAMDTSTPAGKAMVHMCAVFAELEREMIVERVKAGLDRARKEGKRLGRPANRWSEGKGHPGGAGERRPGHAEDRSAV